MSSLRRRRRSSAGRAPGESPRAAGQPRCPSRDSSSSRPSGPTAERPSQSSGGTCGAPAAEMPPESLPPQRAALSGWRGAGGCRGPPGRRRRRSRPSTAVPAPTASAEARSRSDRRAARAGCRRSRLRRGSTGPATLCPHMPRTSAGEPGSRSSRRRTAGRRLRAAPTAARGAGSRPGLRPLKRRSAAPRAAGAAGRAGGMTAGALPTL